MKAPWLPAIRFLRKRATRELALRNRIGPTGWDESTLARIPSSVKGLDRHDKTAVTRPAPPVLWSGNLTEQPKVTFL